MKQAHSKKVKFMYQECFCILFLGASLRIIQLVQHYEHLVSAMANACAIFVNDFGCKNIIGDILR